MTPYPHALPSTADLRPTVDAVFDQGQLGSCTANAADKALNILYERVGQDVTFSRLYLYYYERAIANALNQEGAQPSNMAITLQTKGVCLESSWPYDPAQENIQPPITLDTEAAQYKIGSVESNAQLGPVAYSWIKNCIANGSPVLMSFNVSTDFMNRAGTFTNWRTTTWDNSISSPSVGSHEVCIIGWEDNCADGQTRFLVQNSWGPNWGDGGFFGFPIGFLGQASSLYAITSCNVPFVPLAYQPPPTPPVPTSSSTVAEMLDYIYITQFKRVAEPAGRAYWTDAMLKQMTWMIRSGAQGSDKDVMPP